MQCPRPTNSHPQERYNGGAVATEAHRLRAEEALQVRLVDCLAQVADKERVARWVVALVAARGVAGAGATGRRSRCGVRAVRVGGRGVARTLEAGLVLQVHVLPGHLRAED
jgi:hypothetical protein